MLIPKNKFFLLGKSPINLYVRRLRTIRPSAIHVYEELQLSCPVFDTLAPGHALLLQIESTLEKVTASG